MTAVILPFRADRLERMRARRVRDTELEASRHRWADDLATWPKPFHALAVIVDRMSVADVVQPPVADSVFGSYEGSINLAEQRAEGAQLDFLRERGLRRLWTEREYPRRLLFELWSRGVRRFDRKALQEPALEHVMADHELAESELERKRQMLAGLLKAIETGIVQSGARKGQPYAAGGMKRTRSMAETRAIEVAELEREIDVVFPWALEHPISYALGGVPRCAR